MADLSALPRPSDRPAEACRPSAGPGIGALPVQFVARGEVLPLVPLGARYPSQRLRRPARRTGARRVFGSHKAWKTILRGQERRLFPSRPPSPDGLSFFGEESLAGRARAQLSQWRPLRCPGEERRGSRALGPMRPLSPRPRDLKKRRCRGATRRPRRPAAYPSRRYQATRAPLPCPGVPGGSPCPAAPCPSGTGSLASASPG